MRHVRAADFWLGSMIALVGEHKVLFWFLQIMFMIALIWESWEYYEGRAANDGDADS